ncbi:heme exporter protein CcmD [Hasllibacter sp. MH4015]|uniref:heme exporter protein CcmD n=1 Tax=Hasllibacter sp. MH4015 TaxID=2854029 RepID=UPI001CD6DCF7|nr:heme exporter protein CcmD [Hasllibacter sp. MH4015]
MNVDLGQYAAEVLSAYAGTLALLALLLIGSIWKARRVARHLADVEARRERPVVGAEDAPRSADLAIDGGGRNP